RLSKLLEEQEEVEIEFRDAALDLISEALTMYKVTVAQARLAESVEEVAILWNDAHAFYEGVLTLWRGVTASYGDSRGGNELFDYCRTMIEKLEQTTAEHYAFHARSE